MIVDVHAHYVSPALIDEARRNGAAYGLSLVESDDGRAQIRFAHSGDTLRPFFEELCDLPVRLTALDASNVDIQVVSAWTDMSGDDLPPASAARWARLQNETMVDDTTAAGSRFEPMGTLPLANVPAALEELDRLANHTNVRSLELGTNVNGRDLDHEDFRPVWERIADYEMFVLLHPPFRPVGLERTGDYFLNNLLSFPMDTTIAATRLLFGGVLQRWPALKICLAHGGGFLPYQIGRLGRGYAAHPACKRVLSTSPQTLLSSFFYDTLTHDTRALAYLSDVVGPQRLLYGSDYPFEMLDPAGPSRIRDLSASTEVQAAILGGNAQTALLIPSEGAKRSRRR